ncbi:MAG: Gfo/Idh/MocA family protein [Gemmatimonadota bacterium]
MTWPLGLGLVGCGRVAERFYGPAFGRLSEVTLTAVTDPRPDRAALLAAGIPGCAAVGSLDALLDRDDVAGVILATPPATHLELAARILDAGKPVLVEKPLTSSTGAEAVDALPASAHRSLMMGFNRRFWEPARRLRSMLSEDGPVEGSAARLILTTDVAGWDALVVADDPLDDLASHQLDLLRYLFDGAIVAVSARWTDRASLEMRVRLATGVSADTVAAHGRVSQESVTVDRGGKRYRARMGSERLDPADGWVRWLLDGSDGVRRRLGRGSSSLRRSFDQELIAFAGHVRDQTPPRPGLADGIAVWRAAVAARQSAAQGGAEVQV